MAGREVNVLLTSVGRRVELVHAFREAYGRLGLGGAIIGADNDALAPALRDVDRFHLVPRIAAGDYVPALAEICRRERVDLVFPLVDPDIPRLAEGRRELESAGARVVVLDAERAEATADKWRTLELFRSLEVPVPRSWLPGPALEAEAELPLFVKPRRGSAGKDAFRADTREQLAFFLGYVPDPMIQELLPGPELTIDIVCGLDGRVLGGVARRRIEVRWGEVAKGVTVDAPEALEHAAAIARALDARGPITVQCMLKEGRPLFTEVNARFGGGAPLGIAAGVDGPAWLLAEAAGLPVDPPPFGAVRHGLHLTRYDMAHYLTEQDLAEAERRRIRPG